jgi:hypothetical protein
MGCEVKLFGRQGVLDDKEYLKIKNHCWKGSEADWVIVCDADEILYFSLSVFFPNRLEDGTATIFKTEGFNVFSNDLPKESWREITTGIHDNNYSKLCIFNPKSIKEINYVYGCHEANPVGDVRYSEEILPLLHYKHVGGPERIADRHALYESRRSDFNKKWKLGHQYAEPREQTIRYFNECLKKSVPYSQAGF